MAARDKSRRLSHLGPSGRPRMVDVSGKPDTAREATARGNVYMSAETLSLIVSGKGAKGDVLTTAKTGVEMEALTAVSVAALTVYDMAKAAQKDMRIGDIRLVRKTGGKSGDIQLE